MVLLRALLSTFTGFPGGSALEALPASTGMVAMEICDVVWEGCPTGMFGTIWVHPMGFDGVDKSV